jgi:hypothetical protein
MNKKVYLVTSGSYSDYGVDAVFSNRETAQKFIDKFPDSYGDKREIEEWELDPFEYEIREGYDCYFLRMSKDGTCTEINMDNNRSVTLRETSGFDRHGDMWSIVLAKDEKHAIKITNERRAQHIANNTWVEKK